MNQALLSKTISRGMGLVKSSFAPAKPEQQAPEDITVMLPEDVPLTLMRVPGSADAMNRCSGKGSARSDDALRHGCPLTQDFYMGKYTITKIQWWSIMKTAPWKGLANALNAPESPVVYVSWNDAQDFIAALNDRIKVITGKSPALFRLPSEAEWQYAAQAGAKKRFYWGDDPGYTHIDKYAWYRHNAREVGNAYAHLVGLKMPNAFGLFDMCGNVWEWCDNSSPGHNDALEGDKTESAENSRRPLRGGSWADIGSCCCTVRQHTAGTRLADNGFRILLAS